MKNIDQILKDIGVEIPEEKKAEFNTAFSENYKTVAEVSKLQKKYEASEADRDSFKTQLEEANNKIAEFADIDVNSLKTEVESWKNRVKEAEEKATKSILERDQRDYLKAKFDELDIPSKRIRKSLMDDIMGDDGLKWKDGQFYGFMEYMNKINETEKIFKTAEEKETEAKQNEAKQKAPKWTEPSEGKAEPTEVKKVPILW